MSPGTLIDLAAGFGHPAGGLVGVAVFAEIGVDHVCPFASKGDGHRAADARVGAGDDRNAVFKPVRPAVALLAVVCLGLHLGVGAGVALFLLRKRRLGTGVLGVFGFGLGGAGFGGGHGRVRGSGFGAGVSSRREGRTR